MQVIQQWQENSPVLFVKKTLIMRDLKIRQYFKKGSSFENITESEVECVMKKLNHRPRKTLHYKTPYAVFFGDNIRQAA
ncbi:MAG: hypothetical protein ACOYM1_01330 [Methylovulum sp.]|jgi:hypothetical protein